MYYLWITGFGLLVGLLIVAIITKDGTFLSLPACFLPNQFSSWRYYFLPILTSVLGWTLLFYRTFKSIEMIEYFSTVEVIRYFASLIFLSAFIGIAIEGFTRNIVPNYLTIPGMIAGCIFGLLVPGFSGRLGIPFLPSPIDSFIYNLFGCALGFGGSWAIAKGYQVLWKKEGLDAGIIKLMGMVGAFLGPSKLACVIFLASLFGTFFGIIDSMLKTVWTSFDDHFFGRKIQFSGLIAVFTVFVFFFGDIIIPWYMGLLNRK